MKTFEFERPSSEISAALEPKIIFKYDSDLSGDVIISKENLADPENPVEFPVSGEAILAFVAEFVRNQRISQLEQASTNEILGIN